MLIFLCHLSFVNGVQFLLTSFCYNVSLKFSQHFPSFPCVFIPLRAYCRDAEKTWKTLLSQLQLHASAGAAWTQDLVFLQTIFWNVPIPTRVPCCFLNTRAVFHMFCLFLIFPERTLNFRTLCMVLIFHFSFGKCQTSSILGVNLDPDLHWPL